MATRIGVDRDLGPFAAELRRRGYDVVGAEGPDLAAQVVSGQRAGMFGTRTTRPPWPVLDADGKTPAEVAAELEDVLRARAVAREGQADSHAR
ncbi:MAG: YkuS family protein [Firmicutes bacterium]|nr:YkuS family protein [Bacillota bacterium]